MEKVEGILISLIRHNDRNNIATLYTRSHGRLACLSPAGSGKTARMRAARLQPLARITADIRINPGRDLALLSRFETPTPWRTLYFHPVKQTLVLFLQEFLDRLLRTSAPDPLLYDTILHGIHAIDSLPDTRCANAHIAFLISLLIPAGIDPNLTLTRPLSDAPFDMRGGEYLPPSPFLPHRDVVMPPDSLRLPLLNRMTIPNSPLFRFTAAERSRLLTGLLRYYAIHYPGLTNLRTPTLLADILHG